jgi:serine protease Do
LKKGYIFICVLVCFLQTIVRAQDTIGYRDDEVFRSEVYRNVRIDLSKGLIKGYHALKAETENLKPSQKVSVPYKMGTEQQPLLAPDIYKHLEPSVLIVWKLYRRTTSNIEGLSCIATAFPITGDGIIVTNYHVLQQIISKDIPLYEIDSTLFLSDAKGNIFGIDSVLTYNVNADIALFKVKNIHHTIIHPLSFGKEAATGAPVYLLAHPDGFPYYFSSGIVSRTAKYSQFGDYSERMDVTADYGKGSSGGPVVDQYGNVIGVVSSTHSIYANDRFENLQMVVKQTIPVKSIITLIK